MTLDSDKQPLWLPMGCSAAFHTSAVVALALFTMLNGRCSDPQPIIQDALEVSVVSLPKSKTRVPDRAQRAAAHKGSEKPKAKPEPKPIKESELVEHVEKPKPGTSDADRRREELMRQIERQQLMDDLMAADGAVDRDATDPNGEGEVGINVHGKGSKADPEYVRWVSRVQQLMMQHFKPLSAITSKNAGLRCRVLMQIDLSSGRILSWSVQNTSGIPAYDAAAERAVQEVGQIPLPPAAWLPLAEQGVAIDFTPP